MDPRSVIHRIRSKLENSQRGPEVSEEAKQQVSMRSSRQQRLDSAVSHRSNDTNGFSKPSAMPAGAAGTRATYSATTAPPPLSVEVPTGTEKRNERAAPRSGHTTSQSIPKAPSQSQAQPPRNPKAALTKKARRSLLQQCQDYVEETNLGNLSRPIPQSIADMEKDVNHYRRAALELFRRMGVNTSIGALQSLSAKELTAQLTRTIMRVESGESAGSTLGGDSSSNLKKSGVSVMQASGQTVHVPSRAKAAGQQPLATARRASRRSDSSLGGNSAVDSTKDEWTVSFLANLEDAQEAAKEGDRVRVAVRVRPLQVEEKDRGYR